MFDEMKKRILQDAKDRLLYEVPILQSKLSLLKSTLNKGELPSKPWLIEARNQLSNVGSDILLCKFFS